MYRPRDIQVGIEFSEETITFITDSASITMYRPAFEDMVTQPGAVEEMIRNIATSLQVDGIDIQNPQAVKAHIEGRTYKW